MLIPPPGAIAVIFLSGRTAADPEGYGEAAAAMERAAASRDGYLGIDSTRDDKGVGITISWWRDGASALAWRDDPDHARIRDHGRAVWYDWYRVIVTTVDRAYEWARPTAGRERD
ncbi:antibiotic biosynthesis monooxygenase family protein [Sphingomonas abietis]|uniref:Antibiotic biosynthesis monooxygenase n=1 Tax=Sphingomonas abietis TaxID=3012344 RepID=A0ABY7NPN8_9SPHN|nr:antibiotic biosynthesis monooxygenase [Sphingomonas abietis]WBO22537.1 antibiotic biosynthesis monooxygenase [Sphingomonas abietis]